MKEHVRDTSKDYDHMIGYVAEENINKGSLTEFLGEKPKEYKPEVKKKERDNEFPEDWQRLLVNFHKEKDYIEFMNKIGSKPVPKLKGLIYEKPGDKSAFSDFFGD